MLPASGITYGRDCHCSFSSYLTDERSGGEFAGKWYHRPCPEQHKRRNSRCQHPFRMPAGKSQVTLYFPRKAPVGNQLPAEGYPYLVVRHRRGTLHFAMGTRLPSGIYPAESAPPAVSGCSGGGADGYSRQDNAAGYHQATGHERSEGLHFFVRPSQPESGCKTWLPTERKMRTISTSSPGIAEKVELSTA